MSSMIKVDVLAVVLNVVQMIAVDHVRNVGQELPVGLCEVFNVEGVCELFPGKPSVLAVLFHQLRERSTNYLLGVSALRVTI